MTESSEPDYRCPVCDQESRLIIGETQAICTNETCRCLAFDPSLFDGGLSMAQIVDLPPL